MSIWSTVEGTVRVPKLSPVGLKEVINSNFRPYDTGRGATVVELEAAETDTSRLFEFSLSFDESGLKAAERVDGLMEDFKAMNFDARYVTTHIRFR